MAHTLMGEPADASTVRLRWQTRNAIMVFETPKSNPKVLKGKTGTKFSIPKTARCPCDECQMNSITKGLEGLDYTLTAIELVTCTPGPRCKLLARGWFAKLHPVPVTLARD